MVVDLMKYERYDREPFAACENPDVPMGKWVLSKLPERPSNILDVGCGTGVHTKWFNEEQKIPTIGITVNKKEIEKRKHENVQYGNMLEIPFPDESFDLVFCLGTIEHTNCPFVALSEMNRVLRTGKYLFLDMPGIVTMGVMDKRFMYHKLILFPIQVRDLMLHTGFDLIVQPTNDKIDDRTYTGISSAVYLARKVSSPP